MRDNLFLLNEVENKLNSFLQGRLAQLVERFVYTEDAGGSSPSTPNLKSAIIAIADFIIWNYPH